MASELEMRIAGLRRDFDAHLAVFTQHEEDGRKWCEKQDAQWEKQDTQWGLHMKAQQETNASIKALTVAVTDQSESTKGVVELFADLESVGRVTGRLQRIAKNVAIWAAAVTAISASASYLAHKFAFFT